MVDQFKRNISYLRISITDLCNLRCQYCMPAEGVKKLPRKDILSIEEIESIAQAAAEVGITKIRLTGGEPLIRKGILDICKRISSIPQIDTLCLTTNGVMLPSLAGKLYDAGVNRINISIDTLNETKYTQITRMGHLSDVLDGIKACKDVGFKDIKLNTVLIKDFNEDEILDFIELTKDMAVQIRFIELMPIGETISWGHNRYLKNDIVLEKCKDLKYIGDCGVAKMYQIDGYQGSIGLISPVSSHLCHNCNRLRVTSDGKLKACLNSREELDIKGLSYNELVSAFNSAIETKPKDFEFARRGASETARFMSQIGG